MNHLCNFRPNKSLPHWQTYGAGHVHGLILGQESLIDFERDKLYRETRRTLNMQQIPGAQGLLQVLNIERSYDKAGRLDHSHSSSHPLGELIARKQHYGQAGQLLGITMPGGLWKYPDPTINPKDFIAVGMDPNHIPTKTLVVPGGQWDYQSDAQQRLTRAQRTIQLPRMPGETQQPAQKQPAQDYYYDRAGNRLFAEQRLHSEQDLWEELVRQNQDNPDFKAIQPRELSTETGLSKFRWPQDRVLDNGQYTYEHDVFGNVRKKYTTPNDKGESEHHEFQHNTQQQLIRHEVHYLQAPTGNRKGYDRSQITDYEYDPLGRRIFKQTQEYENGQAVGEAIITHYGWDGDRQVLIEQGDQHIHTIYEPNSFAPMIRIEGKKAPPVVSLARKMNEKYDVPLTKEALAVIDKIERELRSDRLSPETQRRLMEVQINPLVLKDLLDPEPTLEGKTVHFYINDHMGTPLFLVNRHMQIDWYREQDPWGKTITEFNPKNLHQPIRMQGQHYDEESGLHYNRHRYYDPAIGRYLTPDPLGLLGGLNLYAYAGNNSVQFIDPYGLYCMPEWAINMLSGAANGATTGALALGLTGGGPVGALIGGILGGIIGAVWSQVKTSKPAGNAAISAAAGVGTSVGSPVSGALGGVAGFGAGAAVQGVFGVSDGTATAVSSVVGGAAGGAMTAVIEGGVKIGAGAGYGLVAGAAGAAAGLGTEAALRYGNNCGCSSKCS